MASRPEYREKCQQFFDQADADKTGCLSPLELCKVAQKCGCNNTVDEIAAWFDEIDKNDDEKLTFDEFWSALNKRDPGDVQESDLRCSFKEFDADDSGCISNAELRNILVNMGEDPGLTEAILEKVDTNEDGKINIEEFLAAWKQNK